MLYVRHISTTYCVLCSHATLGLRIVNVALYSLSTFSSFVPNGNKLQQSPKWTDTSATSFEIQTLKHVGPFLHNLLKSEIKKQYIILTLLGRCNGHCLKYYFVIIIIIFLHGLGRLTFSDIDALPSFPGASTVSSSSRFVVEGVFRQSGVVLSFKVVDPVLFLFESHVLYSRGLQFFPYD